MTRVVRLFLVLALLLAPLLHPVAMAGAEMSAGSTHRCSANTSETTSLDNEGSPQHGSGVHVSCAVSGACDPQTILANAETADRRAGFLPATDIAAPIGLHISPDPAPPRASF